MCKNETLILTMNLLKVVAIELPFEEKFEERQGMFFKDSNTMAFYNLLSGATIHLQIKERRGRKNKCLKYYFQMPRGGH
ncbi:splicing factor 3A subunit 1-like [Bactrocera neohumeralis]|uniref:splicing factor 3A subunit 1-like n=1 Tax=Bactrocera neohumeralis TaxID=98809 RepID=UPI0021652EFA|nr:splicing factor 3A subunit 1-like [Bactrocera neohumeralis]